MTHTAEEIFKAIFAIALFVCVCGLIRLIFLARLDRQLRVAVGGFLALMMLPSAYLYLRLAFPSVSAALLPLQSMAIWMYGPLLLAILHFVSKREIRRWQAIIYVAPMLCAVFVRMLFHAQDWPLPAWWELLTFAQASLFAAAAVTWTIRARRQLRIALRDFPGGSFGRLLYLSAGLFGLLLADFVVHWRIYDGAPLTALPFYLLVTPCAVYPLLVSMVLIWARPREPAPEDLPASRPVEGSAAADSAASVPQIRQLELSPAAAAELEASLHALMREQHLYTRNDLTLAQLATHLRVSTHLASELLNAHMGTGFYEFLNRHRTADAAAQLRAGKGKLSITDVAYQAGFNNPNTFFREFRRAYGMTPAQFRRSGGTAAPLPGSRDPLRPQNTARISHLRSVDRK